MIRTFGIVAIGLTLGLSFDQPLAVLTPNLQAGENSQPVVVKLVKLKAPAPADWLPEKPANRLRSYQFRLKGADGQDGEISVLPESPTDPARVFPRWKATFVPPEGKTLDDIARQSQLDIPGGKIHMLDITGTWRYKERPFDPKSKEEIRENYRVVWILVVEGDDGTLIRVSGPEELMAKAMPGVEQWLKSLK